MPAEMLAEICTHVDSSDDLKAVSRTCSALRLEAQKVLFSEVTLVLSGIGDGSWRKGDSDPITNRLRRKLKALAKLPFRCRTLRIEARDPLPFCEDWRDGPMTARFLLLRKYLHSNTTGNIDTVVFYLEDRQWSWLSVCIFFGSKHKPTRVEFRDCAPSALSGGVLQHVMKECPTWKRLGISIPMDPYTWSYTPLLDDPDLADLLSFFSQRQPQLVSLDFASDCPWQTLVSPAFLASTRSLRISTYACAMFEEKLEQLQSLGSEVMIEDIEIVPEPTTRLEAPGQPIGPMALCPRLRRARVACEFDDGLTDPLKVALLPKTLEQLDVMALGGDECNDALSELAEWAASATEAPNLRWLGIHVDWKTQREWIHEAAEDGNLVDADDEEVDAARNRYHWIDDCPMDADFDEALDAIQDGAIPLHLSVFTDTILRARKKLRRRGIGFAFDGPEEDRSWGRLRQTLM